jgi:hypothetical protein
MDGKREVIYAQSILPGNHLKRGCDHREKMDNPEPPGCFLDRLTAFPYSRYGYHRIRLQQIRGVLKDTMKLDIEDTDDLDWAIRHQDGVTELRYSSLLIRSIGLEGLIESMKHFRDLDRVRVADDYIRDADEIANFEISVGTMYPDIVFQWTYDLRVNGKHGR